VVNDFVKIVVVDDGCRFRSFGLAQRSSEVSKGDGAVLRQCAERQHQPNESQCNPETTPVSHEDSPKRTDALSSNSSQKRAEEWSYQTNDGRSTSEARQRAGERKSTRERNDSSAQRGTARPCNSFTASQRNENE